MVSLAINIDPGRSPTAAPEPEPQATDLRSGALWYPDVPAPALCLNQDALFPSPDYLVSHLQYKPLIWCHFGGPGGKYLPHLTRVLVTSGAGTRRIDFFFGGGGEDVPAECRSLGRLGGLQASDSRREAVEFPVDGPGGERIEAVEIGHWFSKDGDGARWVMEHGIMVWFKVCFVPPPSLYGSPAGGRPHALFTHPLTFLAVILAPHQPRKVLPHFRSGFQAGSDRH